MTSADELRAAASKIRAICAGVQATPWTEDNTDMSWQLRGGVVGEFQLIKAPKKGSTQAEYWPNWAERQHILMWQPDTALLVADWLDQVAVMWDGLLDNAEQWAFLKRENRDSLRSGPWDARHALAIARAINGTEVE